MNDLQTFLARGNSQSRSTNQELAVLDGQQIYGTFGDAQSMPIMTSAGYQDHIVVPFKASSVQFAALPEARRKLSRPLTAREYFVQMVDYTNPVVYTFILVDRIV